MPVIRATKDKDFTVMSIHHLRDTRLSLKAIGLFSIILSLPPEWKFSIAWLTVIFISTIPHLFRKKSRIIPLFPHNL